MKTGMKDLVARSSLEQAEGWREWIEKLPYLSFPRSWRVKIIPPFTGAMVRFLVTKEGKDGYVSVYFDNDGTLGYFSGPYWEIYPVDDDTARCSIDDVDALMKYIKKGLKQL